MKHQIREVRLLAMVQKSGLFGLPLLDMNPFSTRPLESGDAGKLIGRSEEFNLLRTYLKLGTARRIMLTGPLGSGRTSLVRCLKPYAGAYISIDHLPAQAPAQAMLEMCYQQLIGGDTLPERTELVNQLVTEMYAYTDKLPLVVIDVPASDFSVVDVALRDAHSSLERLNAVVVLVCDVRERNHLPATVVTGFERFLLSPFGASDVVELVEHRLRDVGVMSSNFSLQDAETILEECSGYPSEVVATLRDAVDRIRIEHAEGVAPPYRDTSARLQPRDESQPLDALRSGGQNEQPFLAKQDEGTSSLDAERQPASQAPPGDIIDASTPWNERQDAVSDPTSVEVKVSDEENDGENNATLDRSLFELDMDGLDRSITNDDPLKPPKFTNDIIDASSYPPARQPVASGGFGNLVNRNKVSLSSVDAIKKDAMSRPTRLEDYSEAAEWWVEETSLADEAVEEVPEAESAALIHDEIGLPAPEPEALFEPEVEGLETSDEETVVPSLTNPVPSQPVVDETTLSRLLQLLMGERENTSSGEVQHLVDFFAKRRVERTGPKESYALDKVALGTLTIAETYVVGISNSRAFSPSDPEILGHLDIKRSRLSQISNRLLKFGILQVRPSGRTRKYSLTQAARAQLLAWGALKGGEA